MPQRGRVVVPANGVNGVNGVVRKRPVRTLTAHLDGDYEGTEAVMVANPPLRVLDALSEQNGSSNGTLSDFERTRRAIAQLTLSWNFVDADGEPVPLDDRCSGLTIEEVWMLLGAWYTTRRDENGLPKESDARSESTGASST